MLADVFVLLDLVTAFLVSWFGALALARVAVGNSTSWVLKAWAVCLAVVIRLLAVAGFLYLLLTRDW